MADSMTGYVRKASTWSIAVSALMIVAGVLAVCIPVVAGETVTALVGALLIFSGLLHVAFAWREGRAGGILWEILIGVLYGAVGLYLLIRPAAGLISIPPPMGSVPSEACRTPWPRSFAT